MKKLISLLFTLMLAFSLFACGGEAPGDNGRDYELVRGETPVTDRLALESDYEGKSYAKMGEFGPVIADGIGEVELDKCNDGDTAHFLEDGIEITSRFLAIDTPESGHLIEPWGIAAGEYACEIMKNADTIVLEREPAESAKGNYGRFLSYVWVDGRLLNLEMVEQGFSGISGVASYKYADAFYEAEENAQELGLRLFGEEDPSFPKDDAVDVSIETLVENPEEYMYRKVNIEGVVTNRIGNTNDGNGVFIESHDSDYGIYFNLGYRYSAKLNVGYNVIIENARFARDTKDFEAIHITDFLDSDISNPDDFEGSFTPQSIPFEDLTLSHTGRLFEYTGLKVVHVDKANDLFTVEDSDGQIMPVHQHEHIAAERRIDLDTLETGSTIDLKASLSVHDEDLTFFFAFKDDVTLTEEEIEENAGYYFPEELDYDGPDLKSDFETMSLYLEEDGDTTGGGGSFESELIRCIDGDTAVFEYPSQIDSRIESNANSTRFLNIDTPETYQGGEEEWGKTASVYVCDELSNAEGIKLQTDTLETI